MRPWLRLEQLRALICAADEREPEAERREGVTLVEDIAALMHDIETVDVSPDGGCQDHEGIQPVCSISFIIAYRRQARRQPARVCIAVQAGSTLGAAMRREKVAG